MWIKNYWENAAITADNVRAISRMRVGAASKEMRMAYATPAIAQEAKAYYRAVIAGISRVICYKITPKRLY